MKNCIFLSNIILTIVYLHNSIFKLSETKEKVGHICLLLKKEDV